MLGGEGTTSRSATSATGTTVPSGAAAPTPRGPASWNRRCPASAPVPERREEWELLGHVREHRPERALDSTRPGAARILGVARFAPCRELR